MVRDGMCGLSVDASIAVAISNLHHFVFGPFLAPMPNFIQIGQKHRSFHFQYWSVLVGRAGRSKNGGMHIKLILCCFWVILSPHTKFNPNLMKSTEVGNFDFWSVLVGRAGWSKNDCSHFTHSIAAWNVIDGLCTKFELNRMKIGLVSPF